MGDGFRNFPVFLIHGFVAGRRGLGSGRAEATEHVSALGRVVGPGRFLRLVLLLLTLLMTLAGLAGLAGLVVPVAA